MDLTEKPDGSGTISFGPQLPWFRNTAQAWPGAQQFAPPAFEMIEDAKKVYDLVRKTQKEAG